MLNHQFYRGSHRINMWAKIFLLAVTVNLIYCEERIIYKYKPIYTEHGSNEKYILKSPYRQIYREPAPTHEEEEQSVLKNHGLQNLNYFRPEEANSGESHIEYQHHPVSYRQYYQGHEDVHQEDQNKYVAHYPVHHSEPETKIKYYIPNHIEHENHANKYPVPHIPVHHVEPESDIKFHHVPVKHHIESEYLTHHNAESHDEPIDYYAYPKYQYEYKIEDPHTGDNKFHHEYRDGDTVKGVYSLVEPDGSIRTVEYSSDKHHGFNAVVKHSAPNHNVQVESNHEV